MSNRRFAWLVFFIVPLLCSVALWAPPALAATTGSGKSASETRALAEFQAISLNGGMDLVVRQGTQQSVQVEADDNLLPLLETVVESTGKGATLAVRFKRGESVYSRSRVLITVVMPRLSAVTSAGSGKLRIESYTTPALQLVVSGAGDVELDTIVTENLGIRISGSGNVAGKGTASKLAISIAGSGDVSLADLRSDDTQVSIAGSGDARVSANKTLNVRIAGSGDVVYSGNAVLNSKVAGSGSVSKK